MTDTQSSYGWGDMVHELLQKPPRPNSPQEWRAFQEHNEARDQFFDAHAADFGWGMVGVAAVVMLVIGVIVQRWKEKRAAAWRNHLASVHGTARWQLPADLAAGDMIGKKATGLIVGKVGPTDELIRFDQDGHLLTFAPTGGGKGVSAIIPNLLTYPGSVVIIDPKGENAAITARHRREMGQAVHILDPFGKLGDSATAFNPLDWINPDGDEASEDAALLAEALAPPEGQSADPFWSNEARSLISGLLLYIAAHEPPEKRNLGRLRDFLSQGPKEWQKLLQEMQDSPNQLIAMAGNRMAQKADKEAASVMSTAQSHTHFLDSRKIRAVLEKTTVDLMALKKQPITVYLVLPAEQLQNHGRWLRLMITMLLRAVSRNEHQPEHDVLFLLDEFAALGHLPMIKQAFGLMRGYGLRLWPILQDLPQLQGMYKDGWQTFIANAGAVQVFGTNDRATAEYVSKMLGQTTTDTGSKTHTTQGTSESTSVTGRPLMMPDEVLRIPKPDEVLLLRSAMPVICARVIYHTDKRFIPLADPNPYLNKKKKA